MGKNDFYESEYMPKMHRIGKVTGFLGVVCSFLPAVMLAVVYGLLPDPAALLTAFIAAASAFGFLWIVEPISYFTVLGPIGTYMAFLSGNISNMRVPCASMAQIAAGVEPGTEKGSGDLDSRYGNLDRHQCLCTHDRCYSWKLCSCKNAGRSHRGTELSASGSFWSPSDAVWNPQSRICKRNPDFFDSDLCGNQGRNLCMASGCSKLSRNVGKRLCRNRSDTCNLQETGRSLI